VAKDIERMEREAKQMRTEALKMCWYMRGGVSYDEAMQMSATEREIVGGIIKENLETTKKTKMPFF
jgi:hypothetical protein